MRNICGAQLDRRRLLRACSQQGSRPLQGRQCWQLRVSTDWLARPTALLATDFEQKASCRLLACRCAKASLASPDAVYIGTGAACSVPAISKAADLCKAGNAGSSGSALTGLQGRQPCWLQTLNRQASASIDAQLASRVCPAHSGSLLTACTHSCTQGRQVTIVEVRPVCQQASPLLHIGDCAAPKAAKDKQSRQCWPHSRRCLICRALAALQAAQPALRGLHHCSAAVSDTCGTSKCC